MNFESRSQAGQDRFAYELIGEDGVFLDVGANHPSEKSNSFALERMGWNGVLVETDAYCVGLLRAMRGACLVEKDATKIHWPSIHTSHKVDYLSLDVDWDSLEVLRNLMGSGLRFRVLTVETDAYRFGTDRRDEMAQLLADNGYTILCADVMDQGLPFEIWAVDPFTVDMVKAEKFRREGPTDWKSFWEDAP